MTASSVWESLPPIRTMWPKSPPKNEAHHRGQANVTRGLAACFTLVASTAHRATAGEVILMLAGPSPAEVRSGLDAALGAVRDGAAFQWANDAHTVDDSVFSLGLFTLRVVSGRGGRRQGR